jgi:hypothetical protein
MWGFIFNMAQEFNEMTSLHLEAYIACNKLIKRDLERELNQYTQVLSYIKENMEGYDFIMQNIESLIGNIVALSSDITEAQKWQR